MEEDRKMVEKRRFERMCYMIEVNSHKKHEEIPENKEIFICGLEHSVTEK